VHIRVIRSLIFLTIIARPAAAQAPDDKRWVDLGPPSMHMAASKTVKVAPDELVSDLTALGTAPTPITAQRQVNTVAAKAKALTDKAPGLKVAFQGYSVTFVYEKPTHWVAQQTIDVRGGDGEAVLTLVGHLQAEGLSIGNLGWQISKGRAEKAYQTATIDALHSLRDQANEAARAVGMEVDRRGSESGLFGLHKARGKLQRRNRPRRSSRRIIGRRVPAAGAA